MKQISAYECRICRRGSKLWKIQSALSIATIRLLVQSVCSPSGIDQSCSSGRLGALQVKSSCGCRLMRIELFYDLYFIVFLPSFHVVIC